jgi:hypothetical protein
VSYTLGSTWTTAGFTQVCNNTAFTIPIALGSYTINFVGGSTFTYTGGGVYVAWEFSNPASLVLLTIFAVLSPAAHQAVAQTPDSHVQAPAKKKAASAPSLSGCIDEKNGRYVLVDDRSLETVADLEADGFPTEGFAKHVGHKVRVKGISSSGSTRPVFKVRSIETLSETCAPTSPSDKQ